MAHMEAVTLPVQYSVEPPPTSASLYCKTGASPRRRPVCGTQTWRMSNRKFYCDRLSKQPSPTLRPSAHLSNAAAAAARVSLEDDVIDVGQRGPDAFQQQVQRLNGFRLLNQVITAGAQRQTEMELKQTHEHQDGNTTLTQWRHWAYFESKHSSGWLNDLSRF